MEVVDVGSSARPRPRPVLPVLCYVPCGETREIRKRSFFTKTFPKPAHNHGPSRLSMGQILPSRMGLVVLSFVFEVTFSVRIVDLYCDIHSHFHITKG